MGRRLWPVTGTTILVVAMALFFSTSVDPHSLMILATAAYMLLWLASTASTARGGRREDPPPGDRAGPGDARSAREHPDT